MSGSIPVRGFFPTSPVTALLMMRLGGWQAVAWGGGWGQVWSLGVDIVMLLLFKMLVETFLLRVVWESWVDSLFVDGSGVLWEGGVVPSWLDAGDSGK